MAKQTMITTFDNPYDYFEEFDKWLMYDNDKGYGTCAYLARIVKTSDQLTEEENFSEQERAIDAIIALDFTNRYKKVSKEIPIEYCTIIENSKTN